MRASRVPGGVVWLALAAVVACGGAAGGGSLVEPESILIAPSSANLKVGASQQFSATVLAAGGGQVSGATVTFSSSNAGVAASTPGGLVTAVAPGTATITARSGSATGSVTVTVVSADPATLQLSVDSVDVAAGASATVATTARDAGGAVLPNATVTYTSSDTSVFAVSGAGVISARSSGVARLTAAAGAARDSVPVVVFRAFTGALQAPVAVPGRPFGVTVSPQGVAYVTEQDGNALARVALGSLSSAGSIAVGQDPGEVIFTASGATAYTVNVSGRSISVVNVASGVVTSTWTLGRSPLRIRLSPDDSRLYASIDTGTVLVFDAATGASLATIFAEPGPLNGMALSRDGTRLYVTSTLGGIAELDATTNTLLRTIPLPGTLQDIGISPDGTELYVAVEGVGVDVVNVATGGVSASMPLNSAFGLRVSPHGYFVAVGDPSTGHVLVYDRVLRRQVAQFAGIATVRRLAFDAAGTTLLAASENNSLYVIR